MDTVLLGSLEIHPWVQWQDSKHPVIFGGFAKLIKQALQVINKDICTLSINK